MSWYVIHLSDEENILGKQFEVQRAFQPIIMVNTAPIEFALFSRFNSEDGSVDIYISPKLAEVTPSIISSYKGNPCEKPIPPGIGLLVGNQNALEHFELWERKL